MFRMVEIVGTSKEGYSEAIRDAIDRIMAEGDRASWFEVMDQRGAVKDGKLSEFQVKLKVAVAVPVPPMKAEGKESKEEKEHVCPTCHETVAGIGHLCSLIAENDEECDWCGSIIANEKHLSHEKAKEAAYICNTCGRTAIKAETLCQPEKIKKDMDV